MQDLSTVLITGASGLIGSALVEYLVPQRGKDGRTFKVYATGRDVRALDLQFGDGVNCVAHDSQSFVESNAIEWRKP